jgi:hypothetical protein
MIVFPRHTARPQQRRMVSLWRAAARTVWICLEQAADLMAAQSGGITWDSISENGDRRFDACYNESPNERRACRFQLCRRFAEIRPLI